MLGTYLRVRKSTLDTIDNQNPDVFGRKGEVLSAWLRGDPDASWNTLVDVLKKMDENTLAKRISDKYLQPAPNGNQTTANSHSQIKNGYIEHRNCL